LASFYLDHSVAVEVTVYLRLAGHTVRTTESLGKRKAGDDEQLAIAAQSGWILVTHNIRDYELLHDAWHRWSMMWGVSAQHSGILALEPGPNEQRLSAAIIELLNAKPDLTNELHVWRPRHGWRQRS
jgi:hypothetical protein